MLPDRLLRISHWNLAFTSLFLLTGCNLHLGLPGFELSSTQAQPGKGKPLQESRLPREEEMQDEEGEEGGEESGDFPDLRPNHTHTSMGIGEKCGTRSGLAQDNKDICLATKYVIFRNDGAAEQDDALASIDAASTLQGINQVWRECGVQFQYDKVEFVNPKKFQIAYNISDYDEMNEIRSIFSDDDTLLIVATGLWNRRGTLGNSWANAWTNTPGSLLYGVVLEASVADNTNLIAHELGHYLNLDHVDDPSALMNPIISDRSFRLEQSECEVARSTAKRHWRKMMR